MRIEIESLDRAGKSFAHAYSPAELALGEEHVRLASDAQVRGRASREGERVRLRGTLTAAVEASCDRCLNTFQVPAEIEFDSQYVSAAADAASSENAELREDDLAFSVYEGDSIDIDELVREQLLLALPTRLLCREECTGLCPRCGANLNAGPCACARVETDPRWAALAELKKDVNRE